MYIEMDCPCKGKNLDKMLQPGILMSLYKQDKYGWLIIQELGDNPLFGGAQPDKTGVYRYLKKMEASGYLTSVLENAGDKDVSRRVYSITNKGRACLGNWQVTLRSYAASIAELVDKMEETAGFTEVFQKL